MAQRIQERQRRLLITELRNSAARGERTEALRSIASSLGLNDADLDRIATAHGLSGVGQSGYHARSVGSSGHVNPQLAVRTGDTDLSIRKARLKAQVEAHGVRFLDHLERPTDDARLEWGDKCDANLWANGERPDLWSALEGPLADHAHRFEKYRYPPAWIDNVVLSNGSMLGWLEHEVLVEKYGDAIRNQHVPDVSIEPAGSAGHGVFAKSDIRAGTFLGEYTGVVKVPSDAEFREAARETLAQSMGRLQRDGDRESHAIGYHPYPDQSAVWLSTIDGKEAGNHTRFVNHSFEPNVDIGYVFLDGSWHAILVANQDIAKGAQLAFDYGAGYWNQRQITPDSLE